MLILRALCWIIGHAPKRFMETENCSRCGKRLMFRDKLGNWRPFR